MRPRIFALHFKILLPVLVTVLFLAAIVGVSNGALAQGQDSTTTVIRRLTDSGCLQGNDASPAGVERAARNCPAIEPVFRIENGFNISKINRISADRECRIIATASEDKTARVFRGDGTPLSVLRPPVGPGNGGKLRSVAVSPDARIVVAGGWDIALPGLPSTRAPGDTSDNGLYVFDPQSGKLLRRLGNFAFDLKTLEFSPDSSRLAIGMGRSIVVLDAREFSTIFRDDALGDLPYGAGFGPGNELFVSTLDGAVRKYDPRGRIVRQTRLNKYGRPVGLAVQPDGSGVAVAFMDAPGAIVLNGQTLEPAGSVDVEGLPPTPLMLLAGTRFGSLAGGGMFISRTTGAGALRIWGNGTVKNYADVELKNDTVGAIAPCGRGFIVATMAPSLFLVDIEGKIQWRVASRGLRAYGKTGNAFRASPDGRRVWFGLGLEAADPVLFDLQKERLYRSENPGEDLKPPIENLLPVTNWNESFEPRLGQKKLPHQDTEMFRAMAQQPDAGGFVLGSEFQLWRFSANGQSLWPAPIKPSAPVFGVNITRDGRLLIGAYGDGTIRWRRLSDGAELLALYIDTQSMAWIAWTPSGYFMSSPGGDDLGGWHLNRGWRQAADFFPVARFRDRFYRPDVVKLVLATLDEGAAVAAADAAAGDGRKPAGGEGISNRLPPVITILSPLDQDTIEQNKVNIAYETRAPSGLYVGQVEVLINGRPSGIKRGGNTTAGSGPDRIEIPLTPDLAGAVELGLVAHAGGIESSVAKVRLTYKPAAAPPPTNDELLKPTLYALVVGVSEYSRPGIPHLKYAAKDANDFVAMLERQKKGLYGPVEVRILTNANATTAAIKEGLAWLDEKVTRHDVGMVFLAGHGETDARSRFWFLTADTDKTRLAATALSREDINVTLQSLRGRVVVFLDACHSGSGGGGGTASEGGVDMNALMSELASSGRQLVVYSSSAGRELSFESPDWQNGAFTKAVIEAVVEGKADLFKTGRITSSLLDAYATKRVGILTGDRQHPLMFRPQQATDFDIAAVR